MNDVFVFTAWQTFWVLVIGMLVASIFFYGWLRRKRMYQITAAVVLATSIVGIFLRNPIAGGG